MSLRSVLEAGRLAPGTLLALTLASCSADKSEGATPAASTTAPPASSAPAQSSAVATSTATSSAAANAGTATSSAAAASSAPADSSSPPALSSDTSAGASASAAPSQSTSTSGATSGSASAPAPSTSSLTPDASVPAGEFALTLGEVDAVDNADCSETTCEPCPQFPAENTGLGGAANTSPLISWTPGPEGTVSYVVVLVDLSNDLTHWVVWDIPASITSLPAALPAGNLTGELNGAKQSSYSGMKYAGSGACNHVYEFRVYALSEPLAMTNSRDAVRASAEDSGAPMSFVRVRSDWAEACTPHIAPECP